MLVSRFPPGCSPREPSEGSSLLPWLRYRLCLCFFLFFFPFLFCFPLNGRVKERGAGGERTVVTVHGKTILYFTSFSKTHTQNKPKPKKKHYPNCTLILGALIGTPTLWTSRNRAQGVQHRVVGCLYMTTGRGFLPSSQY